MRAVARLPVNRELMIDLSRIKTDLLAEIGAASHRLNHTLTDPNDPRFLTQECTRLVWKGHSRDGLFPFLEIILSARFAHLPRALLIRDLLTPLKNGLGNAYRHGNKQDATKSIDVEVVATPTGAVIVVSDEGDGFDVVHTLRRFRAGENYFANHGIGFRVLDRANSLVTWKNGGRSLLIRFMPDRQPRSGPNPTGDPRSASAIDFEALRSALAKQEGSLLKPGSVLESCRFYDCNDREGDMVRCVLHLRNQTTWAQNISILTGRVLASAIKARVDFDTGRELYVRLQTRRIGVPRPLVRLEYEPRVVLYAFDPWMSLREYVEDRAEGVVSRRYAKRIGKCLRALHRSGVAVQKETWAQAVRREEALLEGVRQRLCNGNAQQSGRIERISQTCLERVRALHHDPNVPIHGRLDWDCIHYGVDGRFYLHRFEECRSSHPGFDLGGFLADLLVFSTSRGDPQIYRMGQEELLASYFGDSVPSIWRTRLPAFIASALLRRLARDPYTCLPTDGHEALLELCELTLLETI